MKVLLEIDFNFDGMEDCSDEEFKDCLKEVLHDGSDCTNTDIEILNIQTEVDKSWKKIVKIPKTKISKRENGSITIESFI